MCRLTEQRRYLLKSASLPYQCLIDSRMNVRSQASLHFASAHSRPGRALRKSALLLMKARPTCSTMTPRPTQRMYARPKAREPIADTFGA